MTIFGVENSLLLARVKVSLSFRLRVSFLTCSSQMLFLDTASSLLDIIDMAKAVQPTYACCCDDLLHCCRDRCLYSTCGVTYKMCTTHALAN